MGEVVNLNQFRKKREKAEKTKRSERNRAAHGRAKDERRAAQHDGEHAEAELDGKQIGPETSDEPPKHD
jgi:hypothetical protein